MMASEACCACGGGNKATLPTPAPVENVCTDTPGWHGKLHVLLDEGLIKNADSQFDPEPLSSPDIDGEAFGCSWYGHGSNCLQYGFNRDTENFGLIASEACCSCGGGCSDVEGW